LHYDIIPLEKVVMKVSDEYMTGKEVVNLIRKLREKGMNSDEILDIIEYIETHDPKEDSK
jgi:glutaredoxin 2